MRTMPKRLTLLLFINKRLVESAALKRAVEEVYAAYLPKGGHPFVYLSIALPPAALDVNVHPTKREVHFLDADQVVASVQATLREKLAGANASRTFLAQAELPGMAAGASSGAHAVWSFAGNAPGSDCGSTTASGTRGAPPTP